ncbi:MAG: nhaA [Gammaproteobacteria bacterium]|jgi:NhaA family Na+:H+ antiporter|nr:nhaA [Gammaproteobacteria bacterium]
MKNFHGKSGLSGVFSWLIDDPRAAGALLLACTLIGLIWANSSFAASYLSLSQTKLGFSLGDFSMQNSIQFWVNDGLMAIFFLLVGLEIKREILAGYLKSFRKASLPIVAAVGGMVFPALIFVAINHRYPQHLSGWGVPMATDIAFALSLLGLLSKRIPKGLLVLLTAIAIVDDLGAVLVIAVFYNHGLNQAYLLVAALVLLGLLVLNYKKVNSLWPYLILGAGLWLALLQSGIHATIAGVLLALTIPIKPIGSGTSPLLKLEHFLKLPVMYGIVPIFILLNAGVSLSLSSLESAWHNPITWGIICGLLIGKVLGIFGISAILVRLKWLQLPEHVSLAMLLPMSIIAGIGFTMALFIAELAYPGSSFLLFAKVGILGASLIAAVLGYSMMWLFTIKAKPGLN